MFGIKSGYWQESLFGVVGAAISAWLLTETAQLPERSALFPAALLWCLLVVTAVIAIRAAYLGYTNDAEQTAVAGAQGLLVPAALLVSAGVLLAAFGFYITAPVVIFSFHTLHAHRSGHAVLAADVIKRGLMLAILATLSMYLVFDVLIGLPAPSGTLF
ncbi:MAG: tripartite tricarboxylate transporter TctB family protein [Natronospirillum sp.]